MGHERLAPTCNTLGIKRLLPIHKEATAVYTCIVLMEQALTGQREDSTSPAILTGFGMIKVFGANYQCLLRSCLHSCRTLSSLGLSYLLMAPGVLCQQTAA